MDLIKKTLNQMLSDRYYKYLETNDDGYMLYKKPNNKKVAVYFTNYTDKVGVEYVKNIISTVEKNKINHLILISKDKLTAFANRYIIQYKMKVELFLFNEMKFNITKHKLVPKHVLLSQKDSQQIIDYYGKEFLPRIKQKDAISRYFDAEIGNIFKIYRNEGGINYRLVM